MDRNIRTALASMQLAREGLVPDLVVYIIVRLEHRCDTCVSFECDTCEIELCVDKKRVCDHCHANSCSNCVSINYTKCCGGQLCQWCGNYPGYSRRCPNTNEEY